MKRVKVHTKRARLKETYKNEIAEKIKNMRNRTEEDDLLSKLGISSNNEEEDFNQNMMFPMTEEYFDFEYKGAYIPIENIEFWVGDFEGAEIILKGGDSVKTKETEEEINKLILKLE